MQEVNLFELFSTPLTNADIKYFITGSVASMLYGEPRLTHDIDIVVELSGLDEIKRLPEVFSENTFYLPPEEIIRIESRRERRGHFNIVHFESGYKADIYLVGEDPFHLWAFDHIKTVIVEGRSIPIAPPEYVIIRKLQYYKEGGSDKHLRDIKAIITNPNIELNKYELSRWAQLLFVEKELATVISIN